MAPLIPTGGEFYALVGGILASLITLSIGFFSWLTLRYFRLRSDLNSLDQRVRGDSRDPNDEGLSGSTSKDFNRVYARLDALADMVQDLEECHQEQHQQVVNRTDHIIRTLRRNGINGDLTHNEDD